MCCALWRWMPFKRFDGYCCLKSFLADFASLSLQRFQLCDLLAFAFRTLLLQPLTYWVHVLSQCLQCSCQSLLVRRSRGDFVDDWILNMLVDFLSQKLILFDFARLISLFHRDDMLFQLSIHVCIDVPLVISQPWASMATPVAI